ncbi:histone-lysine N-methyltransferase, H3 lysine-79 specific-like [Cynara cardunculus var. scolymus]|uniref:histone-lysine N-methyltransferase, H3 lysine-79 specific-like n=1 Tax=Cynara cardunculus var. scolymus TaxID=59895 RepID=UPI000D629C4E|nr:histone-lysine N-methyltransferase, H3 lysine-79 specific-like [Cynara cardunculus var. scolymus]
MTEDLAPITEALKELSSTTAKLKTTLATLQISVLQKDDLAEAFSSLTLNPSSIQSLKTELSKVAAHFAADFVFTGYTDYSTFKDKIKNMFSSAVTYGIDTKSSRANINHLATRRKLDEMVEGLGITQEGEEAERPLPEGEEVRKEREQKRKRQKAKKHREREEKKRREGEERERQEREERARKKDEERRMKEEALCQLEQLSSSHAEESVEEQDDSEAESSSSSDNEEGDEGGVGVAVLAPEEPEQPRTLNRHIYFPSPTPSASTQSESVGRATRVIEQEAHISNPDQPIQPKVESASDQASQRKTTIQGLPSQKGDTFENISGMYPHATSLSHAEELVSSALDISQPCSEQGLGAHGLESLDRSHSPIIEGYLVDSESAEKIPLDRMIEIRALGYRLLKKVADYISDFNNTAKQAAVDMRRSLETFKFKEDVEIIKATNTASDIVELFDAKVKAMPPANVQKPKRKSVQPTTCAEASKKKRLDDNKDPDQSSPQSHQEGEKQPAALKYTIPTIAPSASTPQEPAPAPRNQQSRAAYA